MSEVYNLKEKSEIDLLKKKLNVYYKKGFIIELNIRHFQRTPTQNNYMWAVNNIIAIEQGETKAEMHNILTYSYAKMKGDYINIEGQETIRRAETSKMNKEEFNHYIEFILEWASKREIQVPQTFDEYKKNKAEIDRMIKESEIYLNG